jgi:hydroxyacyl-ACP dehydratase HTD2-like protein with hotdog domain
MEESARRFENRETQPDFDNSKLQTAMRHSENGGLETDRRLLIILTTTSPF